MHHRALAGLAVGAVLLLAACSSSGATAAPSAAAPSAAASAAASVAGGRWRRRLHPDRHRRHGCGRDQGLRLQPGRHPGEGRRHHHLHQRRFGSAYGHARRRLLLDWHDQPGLGRRPDLHRRGHLRVPLQDPLEHEGDDHRQLIASPPSRAGSRRPAPRWRDRLRALGDEQRRARRQVDGHRGRYPRIGEPAGELLPRRRVPCPGTARRAGRRRSARPAASGTRRDWTATPNRARPADRRARPAQAARRAAAGSASWCRAYWKYARSNSPAAPTCSGRPCRISIRPASPAASTLARARATESGSNSRPTSSRVGNRRAIAISHRPPPQWMSTTRPPRDRSATAGAARQAPPGRRPPRPGPSAVRWRPDSGPAARGRVAPSGRTRASRPSRATRSPRGRTGRRGYSGRASSSSTTATSSSSTIRSPCRSARPCASAAETHAPIGARLQPLDAASSAAVRPSRPAARSRLNNPSSDADVHQPGPVEAGQAVDQVVEAIVELHPRSIVAWRGRRAVRRTAWSAAARDRYRVKQDQPTRQRFAKPRGSGCRWIPTARSSPPWPETSTDRSRRSCWPTRIASTRSPCGCWAIRRDAEEAAQDAFVRAHRALATYDPERILELRLRPWLATIVLNLCRSRLARRTARAATARPALSLDATELGTLEPRADDADEPAVTAARRDARASWAALLVTLPPAYRTAVVLRHVDGLSYPEVATALDRPEGTVKAQVHRGLALLRTAFEAAQRRERRGDDRMTVSDRTWRPPWQT